MEKMYYFVILNITNKEETILKNHSPLTSYCPYNAYVSAKMVGFNNFTAHIYVHGEQSFLCWDWERAHCLVPAEWLSC